MKAPVTYIEDFASEENKLFEAMWGEFPWERREGTPRKEVFFSDTFVEYTYGKGAGIRTYCSNPFPELLVDLRARVETLSNARFDVCFANGYENNREHLGWHADDSPEVDASRPIAIVSFGAAREIWFCPVGRTAETEKLMLAPGSLCLMAPGMQATHWHRIPKAGFVCERRISLTYRGLAGK